MPQKMPPTCGRYTVAEEENFRSRQPTFPSSAVLTARGREVRLAWASRHIGRLLPLLAKCLIAIIRPRQQLGSLVGAALGSWLLHVDGGLPLSLWRVILTLFASGGGQLRR